MYWELFKVFFRIGAFTIGGGLAMLPVIEREVVDRKKWITKTVFTDIVAVILRRARLLTCHDFQYLDAREVVLCVNGGVGGIDDRLEMLPSVVQLIQSRGK